MQPYQKTQPCVLTDDIFVRFGGQTGTSTPDQRLIAYTISEELVESHLNTPLCPTQITGSYYWPQYVGDSRLQLDVTYLQHVDQVISMALQNCNCDLLSRSGCAIVIEQYTAIVSIVACANYCWGCCGSNYGYAPFLVQIVYTAGLDYPLNHDLMLLQALVTLANNELAHLTNSASGCISFPEDSNITSFSSLDYSESRKLPNVTNIFGSSPLAQYLARMLRKFKRKSALRLH
jgi:hypothetical protein